MEIVKHATALWKRIANRVLEAFYWIIQMENVVAALKIVYNVQQMVICVFIATTDMLKNNAFYVILKENILKIINVKTATVIVKHAMGHLKQIALIVK